MLQSLRTPSRLLALFVFALCFIEVVLPAAAYASTAASGQLAFLLDEFGFQQNACAMAEQQANQDTNSAVWMLGGCIGGVLTIIAAQVVEAKPPATALLGQSPDYVAAYTDCYAREAKNKRTNKALVGCLIGVGAYALLYAAVVVVALSDPYYY